MAKQSLRLKYTCRNCGGHALVVTPPGGDEAVVRCKACGQPFGRLGPLKAKAREAAEAHVAAEKVRLFKAQPWIIK